MIRRIGILLLALAGFTVLAQTALAGQFKMPVYYPGGDLPTALVTADFNNDGSLDMAVGDYGSGVVMTLLGRGDGTFRKGPSFSISPYSVIGLAVGDFDDDHVLDLAVVENVGPANGKLGIFLGNGDGSFRKGAEYQLGYDPASVAAADFNGDAQLDLAVTNRGVNGKGSVMLLFGKGDGTFGKTVIYPLSAYPESVAATDLNGDGRPDLAVAEYDAGVAILLNRGGGKFGKPTVYRVQPAAVFDAVIADVNHDNHPDLVVTTLEAVGVLLGIGGGKFGKVALYSTKSIAQDSPDAVVVADFNGDGYPDIATVLGQGNAGLFYGNGNGTFKPVVQIKLRDGGGSALVAGEFDKDRPSDLAITNQQTSQIAVLLNEHPIAIGPAHFH
jgi:VCBS repeat protein